MTEQVLEHRDLTQKILGVFYDVYNELGHGFLESVYNRAMALALAQCGLQTKSQVKLPVWFRGQLLGDFFADLVVEESVILELKAASGLDPAHEAQLLSPLHRKSKWVCS